MFAYRDFAPGALKGARWFQGATYETFDAAVAAANSWIAADAVKVINVETVVLPNIDAPGQGGTADAQLWTASMANWYQFVRVWYEA